MKKIILALGMSVFFISAYAQQIHTEKAAGSIDKTYRTFAFINPNDDQEPGTQEAVIIESENMQSIYIFADEKYPGTEANESIKTSIKQEMIDRDFKYSPKHPDVLISYMVFNREGNIKGDFDNRAEPTTGIERPETMQADRGTLLITATDYNTGKTIWQGLENGAFKQDYTVKDTDAMKAVSDIMSGFDISRSGTY